MKKTLYIMLFSLSAYYNTQTDGVVETFKKATGVNFNSPTDQLFIDFIQDKKNQLIKLHEEITSRREKKEHIINNLKDQIVSVEDIIRGLERSLIQYPHSKYLNKKLYLHKEILQLLKDIQRGHDDLETLSVSFIDALKKFVEDPECKKFKEERHLEKLPYYSFDDLDSNNNMIVSLERLLAQLAEQDKNTQVERENRKRMLKTLEEEHAKREELQNSTEKQPSHDHYESLTIEQQEKSLIATEEQLFRYKKDLYELRILESKYASEMTQLNLLIERIHLDILKQHLKTIKSAIRVTEPDLIHARELLNNQRKNYFARREKYQHDRDNLVKDQKIKEHFRDTFAAEHGISTGRDLDEWTREPKQNAESYLAIVSLGTLNAQTQLLSTQRGYLETQRALEDEKFNYIVTQTNVKETYYKISSHKFVSSEEISSTIKNHETQKSDAFSTLSIHKERMGTVADLLNQQKKVLDNINDWREKVYKQRDQIFKNNNAEYIRILELLNSAEGFVKQRIDVLGKLTGVYSGIISEVNSTIRLILFILGELQSTTIWYRPEYAITLQGIKNIIPDIVTFFNDIKVYILRLDINTWKNQVKEVTQWPIFLFLLIIKIIILLMLIINIKNKLPKLYSFFANHAATTPPGMIKTSCLLGGLITHFMHENWIFIGTWTIAVCTCMFWLSDPYIYAFFALLSIPFLLFLIHKLIHKLITYNIRHDYAIISSEFQKRFIIVLSVLLYATTTIFFFRQAFMQISYYTTELPTILLAINFIIFQIALISLITKDQILSIIPQKNELWTWIHEQVDYYFYLILLFVIAIIVMSNPYVGFGRLVLYILSASLYTLMLTKLLLTMYRWSKKTASEIFFIDDEEIVRERFNYARTWFGLLIIGSFFSITFIGCVIIAKIWGWNIGINDIVDLAYKPLLLEATTYPITLLSILQIIAFVMAGLVAAYAINRFVLDKIFDLLVVDAGIQYTTTRFIQYFIMIIFIFFGFKNVGLGDLIGYLIGALAIGIGWYVREPIGDFIAYFIILVQRPLKIGDFIKLDNETFGFVRKITPRAVIIRKKNSTTIVIPNSQIMSKTVTNWNYVRNFIAFDDIFIMVSYKEDPQVVKDLLYNAVSSHPNVLRNPKPMVRLEDFGEVGYLFLVRGFLSSAFTQEMWDIASDVRLLIVKILREHNIEIAEYFKLMKNGNIQKLNVQDRSFM